jgi:outer membrane protein
LLDWGARGAGHHNAGSNINSQSAALESARRQAVIDVDQAARRVKVNQQNLRLAQSNASVAKQTADISQVQYKVGVISELDATNAQQTYLQAAKDLLTAQVGYVLAIEKLKLATGTL